MVNMFDVMTKPYMVAGNVARKGISGVGNVAKAGISGAGNLAKAGVCGVGGLICGTNRSGPCCGVGNVIDNICGCDERDDSFNLFGGAFRNGRDTKYEDYKWNDLPRDARNAAETLGINQYTWDAADWTPDMEKSWWDLSSAEMDAAQTLGWDADAWENQYEERQWDELPSHVKEACKSLGFTSDMWNNDEWPSHLDVEWYQLSSDQQKALHCLGYYQYMWG